MPNFFVYTVMHMFMNTAKRDLFVHMYIQLCAVFIAIFPTAQVATNQTLKVFIVSGNNYAV